MQANVSSKVRILQQFLPTKSELLLLIVVNGLVLLSVFFSLSTLSSRSVSEFQIFTEVFVIGRIISWVQNVVDSIITANVATMILWGIIGSFVYSLISGVQAALSDASDTFKSAFLYVHPAGYKRSEYVLQIILQRVVAIVITLVTVLYVWAFLAYFVPITFTGAKESISPLGVHSFMAAGYFIFLSLIVHGFVILFRIGSGRYKPDSL